MKTKEELVKEVVGKVMAASMDGGIGHSLVEYLTTRAISTATEQLERERDELREKLAEVEQSLKNRTVIMTEQFNARLAIATEAKERAEVTLNTLQLHYESAQNAIKSNAKTCDQLRADKEKAERRGAEMRDALVNLLALVEGEMGTCVEDDCNVVAAINALSNNDGTSYVPSSELKEARGLLESCEFADSSGGEYEARCPVCDCKFKHAPDCKLQSFLDKSK